MSEESGTSDQDTQTMLIGLVQMSEIADDDTCRVPLCHA
jgi:hypothetical protein